MKRNLVIVGIGSNINPQDNIKSALQKITSGQELIAISSMVITKPIGITDQADFVNGAAKIVTALAQDDFKRYLKEIEDQLGRDRSLPKYGPRTIDLDIIVWNGQVVDMDYYSRDFLRKAVDELL